MNEELAHNYRVIDLMISMHCALRDRYQRRALVMDITQLLLSVVIGATVFMEPSRLGMRADTTQIIIGLSSIALFFLSLVSLRVDWREKAGRYRQSSILLSKMKGECRELIKSQLESNSSRVVEVCNECRRIMAEVPAIPETDFLRLKAHHIRKVMLSKMISRYPCANLHFICLILWLRANKRVLNAKHNDVADKEREKHEV